VIWGYVTNDTDEKVSGSKMHLVPLLWELRHDDFSNTAKKTFGMVFPNLADQLIRIRQGKMLKLLSSSKHGYVYNQWELELLKGKNFEQYKHTVRELAQFVHTLGVPTFVMTLPYNPGNKDYIHLYPPVERLYTENGIRFINCISEFKRQGAIKRAKIKNADMRSWFFLYPTINPADYHPGPATCHFLACQAALVLEREFPQVLGQNHGVVASRTLSKINDWVPPSLQVQQLNSNTFQFQYPCSNTDMLQMPLRKPFVQLNLENPIAVSGLEIHGLGLQGAQVYLTSEDPNNGYDDGSLHIMEWKDGSIITWKLPNDRWTSTINTIRISAKIIGEDRTLILKLN
jgi:hypothetical protein